MIVVTTPTGRIGRQVARHLLDRGEEVRVVVRDASHLDDRVRESAQVVEGSHADPAVLDTALAGADALFWLVPPDPAAPSAREHYLRFARAAAASLRRTGVGHVVGVTSAGHGWAPSAGVLSAAFAMDEELAGAGAAYRALSLPFYLENLLGQVASIRDSGSFSLTCAPDRPLATIATRDIAERAADLLVDRTWDGQQNLPFFGPDRLTPTQLAAVMSEELGRQITYRRLPMDDFAALLRARGAHEQAVADTIEMFAAQDAGIYDEDWAVAETAPTGVRTWCREVLVAAVERPA